MPDANTICSYALSDVRKSLCDSIDKRDGRKSQRWTAELIATPGAIGSLWAAYWMTWAGASASGPSPVIPILLKQSWTAISDTAKQHVTMTDAEEGWRAFRNDSVVRRSAYEMTVRLLTQPRHTPVVWPTKEITLYDVATLREAPLPAAADGTIVMQIWERNADAMEARILAGRWIMALESGEIRAALSIVAWTLLPPAGQGLTQPIRFADRGPDSLPIKVRQSPIWFWLAIGRSLILSYGGHRGWATMHTAILEAFYLHWKRWTQVERMRLLLAWVLQVREALKGGQPDSIWAAAPLQLTAADVDLPYREIAAELADPNATIMRPVPVAVEVAETKKAAATRVETRIAEADAAVMASLGLSMEDL